AFNLVGPGRAGQLRIADEPRGAVARHIEFRNDSDSPVAGVGNHIADLRLRVIQAIRSHFMQLGELLAFHAKTLVVGEVPMKDVELDSLHAVKIALNHVDRYEM